MSKLGEMLAISAVDVLFHETEIMLIVISGKEISIIAYNYILDIIIIINCLMEMKKEKKLKSRRGFKCVLRFPIISKCAKRFVVI